MKVEQAGYPYIEGERGIPFFQMEEGVGLEILGGSGNRLKYNLIKEELYVYTPEEDSQTCLRAEVKDGALTLDLFPHVVYFDDDSPYHPDLRAGRFVDVALTHFQNQAVPINFFLARWEIGTNKREYGDMRKSGISSTEAANNTWTGKKMISSGFSPAVIVDEWNSRVEAIFQRKN